MRMKMKWNPDGSLVEVKMPKINVLQNGIMKSIDFSLWGGIDGYLAATGDATAPDVIRLRKVVPWMNKAIRMTANAVSQLPYQILTPAGDEVEIDRAWGAVKNPQTIIGLVAASLCSGAAYLKAETTSRAIVGLQYLAPQTMKPVFDNNGNLINFRRTYNGRTEVLSVEEVLYFWLPDDTIETGAAQITPVGNAMSSAGLIAAMDRALTSYGENGFIPPMFAVAEGINPSDIPRVEGRLSQFIQGAWKRVVKVVEAKALVPQTVGAGMEEMKGTYIEITGQQIKNIAAAFGIPNSTFISDENSYATAVSDLKLWYGSSEFVSIYQTIEDTLTDQLWERFGLSMQYTPEQVEAFQQEETDKSNAVASLAGTLSTNPEASLIAMDILGYDLTDEQRQAIEELDEPEDEPPAQEEPQAMEEPDMPTDEDNEIAAEMMKWRNFAEKPRKRAFDVKHIPPALEIRIRAGLNAAKTQEEIQAVFDAAVAELPVIRLARAIEAAHE